MADFLSNKDKHGKNNLADYGRQHWDRHGKAAGSRTLGEASPYLSLADQMPYPFDASGSTATAGIPMPDVKGYHYEYPHYTWDRGEYTESGTQKDIDKFGYYPYFPGARTTEIYDDDGKGVRDILVGVRLIKDT
jgi:hypothetical protein